MAEAGRLRVVHDEREPEAGWGAADHGLPARRDPLFGRAREVERARALLGEQAGLLTLTGPGGVGKTRLALQVAAESAAAFADGVCFVSLAALGDPTLVGPTIARARGLPERGGLSPLARLVADLREKHLLLILDNCEQVLPAAPLVADLLAACPRLAVLATSRAALRLSGERELLVPPLAVPEPRQWPDPDALARSAAVTLFVARARAVQDDFRLTAANGPAVAEICHRLDGLPLAIELAAARVRTLPPQALLPRLGQRLALLTGGARDLPARQQTLRRTIEWSHDLLGPGERTLFAWLAVFVGGRTLEALEAVCGAPSDERQATSSAARAAGGPAVPAPLDVLDGVDALVGQSLVRQEEGPGGEPRFVMLETIHEYARECLTASGEEEALRRRHAAYFLAFAERFDPLLLQPRESAMLARCEAEHDNLRAALGWALERGEAEIALRLAGSLAWFWNLHGHNSEGRRWLARALALGVEGHRRPDVPAAVRAQALAGVGMLAHLQGDHEWARARLDESIALYRALGDTRRLARALNLLAQAYVHDDVARALVLLEENLALSRELGDPYSIGRALTNLVWVAGLAGDYAQAQAYGEEHLALGRVAQGQEAISHTLRSLGLVLLEQGDGPRGRALLAEDLALSRELGHKQGIAYCLEGLAVAARRDRPALAARWWGAAAALREAIAVPPLPPERARDERHQAAVRARMGEAAFAAAWAEGRALPLEQAITEALASAAAEPPQPTSASSPAAGPAYPAGLSAREVEVLRLVAEGLTDAQVAERLFLSPRTVGQHLRSVYNKLGVENRAAATRFAVEHHLT
ncbi:MAG TPA: LuxR C-terminal-related transcriptional regulator [Thermomicrobiales bacterium]|nr:LuxR C-terminal-related transcriptional regulator [Thermomicrobiales bacterium]